MKLNINLPEWGIIWSIIKVVAIIMCIVALAGFIGEFIIWVALPVTAVVLAWLSPRVYRGLKRHGSWRLVYQDLWSQWRTGNELPFINMKDKEK